MSFETSALLLSWVAILLLALAVSGLIRQVHGLANGGARPDSTGLRPGSRAPGLDRLTRDRTGPVLLLFLDTGCRTCAEVLGEAASIRPAQITLRFLYAGPAPATDTPLELHGGQQELFERYDAIVTPFAVLVDAAGRVAWSEPVGSRAALRQLVERATGTPVGGAA